MTDLTIIAQDRDIIIWRGNHAFNQIATGGADACKQMANALAKAGVKVKHSTDFGRNEIHCPCASKDAAYAAINFLGSI